MESDILVAGIVGLVTASTIYVWKSNDFSKIQKIFLILAFLFFPVQWLGIIVILIYNDYKKGNTTEKHLERKIKDNKVKLNFSINNLNELKEKGILTNEEYETKLEKLKTDNDNNDIINSIEYNQLKQLLDNNILTKEEFETKVLLLSNEINTYFIINGQTYTTQEIKIQFQNGNYFLWGHSVITLKNGVRKSVSDIKELDFLKQYYSKN